MVAAFKSLKSERVIARDMDGHRFPAVILGVTFTATGQARIRVRLGNGRQMLCLPEHVEQEPIPRCRHCGEDTTHNRESSFYGFVHRWGPVDHTFEPEVPNV